MEATREKSWIEQLEVTGPIKSLMNFVDELERNYHNRVAAMHRDYERDIETILNTYREEKAEFSALLTQYKAQIATLETDYATLKNSYDSLTSEHYLTSENLTTLQMQIAALTQELKTEQELVTVAEERIRSANEKLRQELAFNTYSTDAPPTMRKPRFAWLRRFFNTTRA